MNEPYALIIGLLFIGGLLAGVVASRAGIPRGAAYVFVGMLFTPDLLGGYLQFNIGAWTKPLTTMALGFSSRYVVGSSGGRLFAPIEFLEETVFLIFFTIAGAHFRFDVFLQHLDLILTYFLARIAGNILGAGIGTRLAGAPIPVVHWSITLQ